MRRLQAIAAEYPEAGLIVLFGSVARGGAAPWSDVDVGVAGVPFWRGLEIGARIGAALDRPPHVVELETASDWLRFQVAREGVVLAQDDPWTWPQFQARAALRYFDVQPIIALCAEGARVRLRGSG